MSIIFLIIGLALAVFGIVKTILIHNNDEHHSATPFIAAIVIGVVIALSGTCFVQIPTGFTGVKATFGQISEKTLPNGLAFRIPIIQTIEKVNNKQQDGTVDTEIWGETEEKVQVYMSGITITYQINPEKSAWIYANVANYRESLITRSLVSSALKNTVAKLPASRATIRSDVEPIAADCLQTILNEKYGADVITIHKVVIADMNFENSYNTAIAQRNNAELVQQRQAIENQTAIEKAEADKKVQVTAAEAKAEVLLTEAEAEKEANLLREASLTDRILISAAIEKWNGELPRVMGSDGLMLGVDSLVKQESN